MAEKDLYDSLLSYYEFMLGKFPQRERLKEAIRQTIAQEDLKVFFLMPMNGYIPRHRLESKAVRAHISPEQMERALVNMQQEGIIQAYDRPGEGRCYERGNPAFMTEQQVRLKEDTPLRRTYAEFFRSLMETSTQSIPNKTPYYRVVPVESTLTGGERLKEVQVERVVPDPRLVMPFDKVSELVKKEKLIAVAECYCRKAKLVVGEPCEHPLETCFVFAGLAQTLIESGRARQLTTQEALDILKDCEQKGLVHNVDNCEGEIKSICNCCNCACVIFRTYERGQTNAGAPSRFVIQYDAEKCKLHKACVEICPRQVYSLEGERLVLNVRRCIGCGLCVSRSPEAALHMVPREKEEKMYPTNELLWKKIANESLVKILLDRVLGK